MAESILETFGLTMRFGGVIAAHNINFKLKARELRCLIGPNGAGKSTFFKCITGQQTPTEGEVYLRGMDTSRWMPHQIASLGVGIKTQTPSVMNGLSVSENIWLSARRFHDGPEAKRKTREIIERLALGAIAKDQLGKLSHGERQLIELGLVIVGDPWLVLLDEPAAGLSGEDIERMTTIINEINKTAAIIIIEHDMQFIRSIAKIVTVFHQGAVLLEDRVDKVMSDPTVRNIYLGKRN